MKAEVLRKSILQMAIQGKLVPQNSSDEPASVLLQKIRAEKEKLIKEGKIKRDKTDSVIFKGEDGKFYEKTGKEVKDITEHLPFEIPNNWVWFRAVLLVNIISGVSYDKKDVTNQGIRILRGGNINNQVVTTYDNDVFLPIEYHDDEKEVKKDDIIIVASTGSKSVIGKAGFVNQDLSGTQIGAFLRIVRLNYRLIFPYIKIIFSSEYYREHIRELVQGTNINNIKSDYINNLLIPLPPLEEQKRIVEAIEKFEPLLAEYDKLEQQAEKLDGQIFDKLKKSILQYAIQGKLVPQDSSDEPASVLLSKIKAEKEKLIKEGKIKKEKLLPPITDSEKPFDIPDSWQWVRLGDYLDVRDGTHDTPKYTVEGFPLVTSKNLVNEKIDFNNVKYISKNDLDIINMRSNVDDGDILFAMIGSIGNPVRVIKDRDFAIKNMALFKPYANFINMDYILLFLIFAQEAMKKQASGGVQVFVSLNYLRKFVLPLPPLNEQKRIVARIEQLFAEIDKIKAKTY